MTIPTAANYVFLPWVRQGAASGIQTLDGMSADQPGIVSVTARLQINNGNDVERQLRLYGPGDVTGIDRQQVVRTEPRDGAMNFEPNYFPSIEFDRPDFPWLFTPAAADAAGKLRPWLCLVVVRKQNGVELRTGQNLPMPVLEIKAPARPQDELPDLSESWVWAHAQVTGAAREAGALRKSLGGDPALTVSRLLCPRRLDPLTEYLACVVPSFEIGGKAGLGLPIESGDEEKLHPAWHSGAQSPPQVRLPVYFHWEFRTGAGGDFEELVGLLEPRQLPPEVGKREMDISRPGFNPAQPLPPGATLELEGALRVLNAQTGDWPAETRTPFQAELKKILDEPWLVTQVEGAATDPLVAPPIYGCWHAGRHTVRTTLPLRPVTPWMDELNLDPRWRAVAAMGTRVVQAHQEQLMASAWEQLGEIERINQMRRQSQLGRAVNSAYYARHFKQFSGEMLLKVAAPAQSRVVVEAVGGNGQTTRALLSQRISQSAIPLSAVAAPLRRISSPRSVISSRFRAPGAPPAMDFLARVNTMPSAQLPPAAGGPLTMNGVSDALTGLYGTLKETVRFERVLPLLNQMPPLGDFRIAAEGTVQRNAMDLRPYAPETQEAQLFRTAAKAHQEYLQQTLFAFICGTGSPMDLSTTKTKLLENLNPEKTIDARLRASLRIADSAAQTGDALDPVMDAPEFPQPMCEALRELSQDLLFPGLERVPPNTVTLLETNAKFVESFLVGLNHEMSRELLWRNYPSDQRGTYFRQFWDTSAGSEDCDIEAITGWRSTYLGDNAHAGENVVLLIRGELLLRYPNAVIYAVRAVKNGTRLDLSHNPADERQPLFRGTLKPDVTFLGFPLTREQAIGDPGWFFVIQEQPTEPRFGMDAAKFDGPPPPPPAAWDELSWRHLVNNEEEFKALSHASISKVLPNIDKAKWGRNSAHQAYITLQRPMRIAIHARQMILQTTNSHANSQS